MKRLLMLLLLLPATAGAQEVVSETWETYCDNGIEKVRGAIVLHFLNPPVGYDGAEVAIGTGDTCPAGYVECWPEDFNGAMTPLGNNNYQVSWQGWPRECVSTTWIGRDGVIVFRFPELDGTMAYVHPLRCSDGPQPIIDNVECSPLPVASSTWGAVKAMYQPKGGKP